MPPLLSMGGYDSGNVPSRVDITHQAHENESLCLSVNYNGSLLATGGGDHKIKVWEMINNPAFPDANTIKCFSRPVSCLAFAQESNLLIASSFDNTAKIIRTNPTRMMGTITAHTDTINCCVFTHT